MKTGRFLANASGFQLAFGNFALMVADLVFGFVNMLPECNISVSADRQSLYCIL